MMFLGFATAVGWAKLGPAKAGRREAAVPTRRDEITTAARDVATRVRRLAHPTGIIGRRIVSNAEFGLSQRKSATSGSIGQDSGPDCRAVFRHSGDPPSQLNSRCAVKSFRGVQSQSFVFVGYFYLSQFIDR